MLLRTLGATLLGNLLSGKGIARAGSINNKGKGIVRPVLENNWIFNDASSFKNFEIQKYYENESRFNGVFSRDNLPKKVKDGTYVINLD